MILTSHSIVASIFNYAINILMKTKIIHMVEMARVQFVVVVKLAPLRVVDFEENLLHDFGITTFLISFSVWINVW